MQNPYIAYTWKQRVTEYPTRRTLTDTTDPTDVKQVYIARDEGTVTEQGDPFTAAQMNAMESRVNAGFSGVAQAISAVEFTELTGTLAAGSTSLVISDASITTSSTVDIYVDTYGISPETVTVATGSITMTFEAQSAALGVKVRVY